MMSKYFDSIARNPDEKTFIILAQQWDYKVYILPTGSVAPQLKIQPKKLTNIWLLKHSCKRILLYTISWQYNRKFTALILSYRNTVSTSSDCPFGCPIIFTDSNSKCYFVHRHHNAHSPMGTPCLKIIASNAPIEINENSLLHNVYKSISMT